MEFEKLQPLLPMANINLSAPNEHVAEIEQCIRTVKEWCWGVMATLPFTYFPNQMTISLVQFAILWLNAIPNQSKVSWSWSQRDLICCHKLDVTKHCWVPFGAYCEVHKEPLLLLWDPLEIFKGHTFFVSPPERRLYVNTSLTWQCLTPLSTKSIELENKKVISRA